MSFVDLMRILPATGLVKAFAALQNLNGKYQRSIEHLPVGNPDELDESNMMQEFLPNNENLREMKYLFRSFQFEVDFYGPHFGGGCA